MSISRMRFCLFALACLISTAPSVCQSARAADVDLLGFDRTLTSPAPADAPPVGLEDKITEEVIEERVQVQTFEEGPELAPVISPNHLLTPMPKDEPKPRPPLDVAPKKAATSAPVKNVKPVAAVAPVIKEPRKELPKDMIAVEESLLVTVANEPDLSGTYVVAKDGTITLPLLGAVGVAGKTPAAVRSLLTARYSDGYLVKPVITVTAGAGP